MARHRARDTFRHEIPFAFPASTHPLEWMQPMELEKVDASDTASGAYTRDMIRIQPEKRHRAIYAFGKVIPFIHDLIMGIPRVLCAGEEIAHVFQSIAVKENWIRVDFGIEIAISNLAHLILVILNECRERLGHIASIA
jgi:hypothetical protein